MFNKNKEIKKIGKISFFFRIVITCFFSVFLLGCAFLTVNVIQVNETLPDITDSKVFNLAQNSRIYAADGTTVLAELQLENREPVSSLDEISKYVIDATIATEDVRFYEHHGVDILGLIRAATVIMKGGETQGGSTITMQLMRNTVLTKEAQVISINRKIAEIILATKIEKIYSKEEILLMYLNTINYGDGCYGIKAAAKHYFHKEPIELDLCESAALVGIPQSPTYLSPTSNLAGCTERRNIVLSRMLENKFITPEEFNANVVLDIKLNVYNSDLTSNFKYPYFTNYVRDQVMSKYTNAEIFEGGFQIYTTLNIEHQNATEYGCEKQNDRLEKGAESVAVTVDPKNGFITSMVGGKSYAEDQYNIATTKGRPTGSSFKAFTLVNAIEQGYDPYSYSINCNGPMKVGETRIENFDNASYGYRTIQSAVAVSSNTGLVRLQQKLSTENVIATARKLGIKNADLPNVATLTLGVADITPLEMASSFATIASGGFYHEPTAIKKIQTANGETIFEKEEQPVNDENDRIISEEIAGAATKVLRTVFTSGTATGAQLSSGQQVAGKTGTSEDFRDHTLIGYTPELVLATWIGKRNYEPTSSYLSCNYLFKTIMDKIYKNKKTVPFPKTKDPEYAKFYDSDNDTKSDDQKLAKAPNVVGKTYSEARSLLYDYDLTVFYEFSDTQKYGIVLNQTVQNGRIVLYVSKGPKSSSNNYDYNYDYNSDYN